MHTFTKHYIDNILFKALECSSYVSIETLSDDEIKNYNSRKKLKDNNVSEDNDVSKDNTISKDNTTSKDDTTPKDNTISKDNIISKEDSTSKSEEPPKKKQKLDTTGVDVLKLVLSREGETDKFKSQFKSSLKSNKKIASTSTNETPKENDSDKSAESSNSSANTVSRIRVVDPKNIMEDDKYSLFLKIFSDLKFKNPPNTVKKSVSSFKASSILAKDIQMIRETTANMASNKVKAQGRGNLIGIEKVYRKYFSKSKQDTIVIIANILNIISMSNKYHKSRMDESFKKKSEAEKLKERCDANRLHGRHKTILETKLKNNFVEVVSSFDEPDFESAFQMFFLSILTVLRVLDQPKFKKGSIFKNLVLLLWNSLKNGNYYHPKIFTMFRSKTFRPDCIELISLIEDSRDNDPGITDRMALFFVSTVNSRDYFQKVIDVVTSDSSEDLEVLIDHATSQCCLNSKFKDPPVDESTVQQSNNKMAATETIKKPANSDETIQHWVLAKNPDGTFQQIPLINTKKTQTTGNTTVEPFKLPKPPLHNFYESFSSSLQKTVSSESSVPKAVPTKKCIVVKPAITKTHLVQVTTSSSESGTGTPTYMTFKPAVQNNKSSAMSPLQRAEGSTILLGNKQYQLVKGPAGQMRAVMNGSNILVKSPPPAIIKCYAKDCNNSATIMCSSCTTVKYCSHSCQRRDWYDNHINDCERLLSKRQNRP
ncbi:uncharacterized protein LOC114124329 isoform X3 [Aphis gossypii]|nr:uncharacterized protein LOC114124329 isoform X3 [Aphis gossypii]